MSAPADSFGPLRTFDWLIAVAASDLKHQVKTTAMTLPGRTGRSAGLTGTKVQPVPDVTAALLECGTRTIERHVATLVSAGYLRRTRAPTDGNPAEYALLGPVKFYDSARKSSATYGRESGGRSPAKVARERGGREASPPATDGHDDGGRDTPETSAISGGVRLPRSRRNVAGIEQPEQLPPPPTPSMTGQLVAQLEKEGIDHDTAEEMIRRATADHLTRNVEGRLGQRAYRAELLEQIAADHRRTSTSGRTCRHGVIDGAKRLGTGDDASALCSACEVASREAVHS